VSSAAPCGPSDGNDYVPRSPTSTVLHQVVSAALEPFLARASSADRCVPRFVERELRAYLECGVLEFGFLRLHCDDCGFDRLLPFSCKGRAFCPSCGGRRMADTAAHLVDRVFPEAPVRQWVLTLPIALRYRMAYDANLTSAVLREFLRAIFGSLRRRARSGGRRIRYPQCGSVTFIQRAGDALNLNVHFHALVLDGVYDFDDPGGPCFILLPPPDDEEVLRVVSRFAERLRRLLTREGLGDDSDPAEADRFITEQPLLAGLAGASALGRVATGPNAGQPLRRLGDRIAATGTADFEGPRCVNLAGISLHANVCVPARDRRRLERLSRYAARPPLSTERLSRREDGRLQYRLRHRWRDGTTHILFEGVELVERLAALVPPPRFNTIRYHGILAPAASCRSRIVPPDRSSSDTDGGGEPGTTRDGHRGCAGTHGESSSAVSIHTESAAGRQRRLTWSELMQRVFSIDVLECPRCSGRLRIIAAITSLTAVRAILQCMGLDSGSRPPPSAFAPPADELFVS